MKKATLIPIFILSFALYACSQNEQENKKVFVYKTVEGHDIKANIFLPESKGQHPVLVYIHGGGFLFGNRDGGLHTGLKDKLLDSGYAVISTDYRLAPETKLNEMMKDVSDLIKWLRENGEKEFNIDINKIAVAGGSAGGYLAYSTGFNKKDAPNAIVSISTPTGFSPGNIQMGDTSVLKQPGPYDMVKDTIVSYGDYDSRMQLWRFLARNSLMLYEVFGFDPATETEKLESYQLTNNISSDYPSVLLLHARYDHLVANNTVEEFFAFLQDTGVDSELFQVDNGHSNELLNQNPKALDKIVMFLNEKLK